VSEWHRVDCGRPAELEHPVQIAAEATATARAVCDLTPVGPREGDERITAAMLGPARAPPVGVEAIADPDRVRGQQPLLLEPARGQIIRGRHRGFGGAALALAGLEHQRRLIEVRIDDPRASEPLAAVTGQSMEAVAEHHASEPVGEHEQHVAELAPRVHRGVADLHAVAAEPTVGPLPHADQLDLDPPLPVGLGTRVVDLEPEVPLQRVAVATATTSRDQMLGRGPERDPARSLGEQLEMTTATQRGIVTRRRMAQRQSHARSSWMLLLLVLFLGVLLVFFLVVLLLALLLGAGAGERSEERRVGKGWRC